MTIKDVCKQTGLSQKTVRLYVEKGLVSPKTQLKNGRSFRIWTEEDLAALQTVASLRRARFTMEEISRMQRDPAEIQAILPRYIAWLTDQQQTLQGLLAAARGLDIAQIQSVEQLRRDLARSAEELPLPEADRRPRFRALDRLEEAQRPRLLQDPAAARLHRDAVPVEIDQDHILLDRRMGVKRQLDDWKEDRSAVAPGGPAGGAPVGPLWLRILKGLLVAAACFLGFAILVDSAWLTRLDRTFVLPALAFLASAAAAAGIHIYQRRGGKENS